MVLREEIEIEGIPIILERKNMKVLMLNGSPRANGNTTIALREMENSFDENLTKKIIAALLIILGIILIKV